MIRLRFLLAALLPLLTADAVAQQTTRQINALDIAGAQGFKSVQQGTGPGQLTNSVKLGWSGTDLKAAYDTVDLGPLALQSWVTNGFVAKGGSTGGAGAFTTLSASGAVSGAGVTALLAPYAPLASPVFTGTISGAATTALLAPYARLASPVFTGTISGAATTALLAPYAPLASPVFTGDVSTNGNMLPAGNMLAGGLLASGSSSVSGGLFFTGPAGPSRPIAWQTASVNRWKLGVSGTEGGANDGANIGLDRFDDSGTYLSSPLVIVRATGAIALTGTTSILDASGGTSSLAITSTSSANGANIKLTGNGATTPNKYLSVNYGQFQIVNSAYSTGILSLDDNGNLSVPGTITGQVVRSAPVRNVYTASGTIAVSSTVVILNGSTALAMALPNGTVDGQPLLIKERGTANATVTGAIDFTASNALVLTATTPASGVKLPSLNLHWSTADATWLVR